MKLTLAQRVWKRLWEQYASDYPPVNVRDRDLLDAMFLVEDLNGEFDLEILR